MRFIRVPDGFINSHYICRINIHGGEYGVPKTCEIKVTWTETPITLDAEATRVFFADLESKCDVWDLTSSDDE